jgi:hypothetical protein
METLQALILIYGPNTILGTLVVLAISLYYSVPAIIYRCNNEPKSVWIATVTTVALGMINLGVGIIAGATAIIWAAISYYMNEADRELKEKADRELREEADERVVKSDIRDFRKYNTRVK